MTKILVYDSDPAFRNAISAAVTSLGYEAVIANDGYNVLPLAEQHRPGAVIVDYKLPEADGAEILKRLRATQHSASTPVVFASATPKFEIEMTVMDAPAVGYVDKPLDVKQLKEVLASLVVPEKKAEPPKAAPPAPQAAPIGYIPPPGAPLDAPAFTGEADLDGSRDDVINLD